MLLDVNNIKYTPVLALLSPHKDKHEVCVYAGKTVNQLFTLGDLNMRCIMWVLLFFMHVSAYLQELMYLLERVTVPICALFFFFFSSVWICMCLCEWRQHMDSALLPVGRGTTWLSVNHSLNSDLLGSHTKKDTHTQTQIPSHTYADIHPLSSSQPAVLIDF